MGEILEVFFAIGFFGGLVIIGIGKLYIGKRDGRTKTGWRNNRKPRWLPGIICYILGGIWFAMGMIQAFVP